MCKKSVLQFRVLSDDDIKLCPCPACRELAGCSCKVSPVRGPPGGSGGPPGGGGGPLGRPPGGGGGGGGPPGGGPPLPGPAVAPVVQLAQLSGQSRWLTLILSLMTAQLEE